MSTRAPAPPPLLRRLTGPLRQLAARLAAPFAARERYHPEKHYMRGPGPRSRQAASRGRKQAQ